MGSKNIIVKVRMILKKTRKLLKETNDAHLDTIYKRSNIRTEKLVLFFSLFGKSPKQFVDIPFTDEILNLDLNLTNISSEINIKYKKDSPSTNFEKQKKELLSMLSTYGFSAICNIFGMQQCTFKNLLDQFEIKISDYNNNRDSKNHGSLNPYRLNQFWVDANLLLQLFLPAKFFPLPPVQSTENTAVQTTPLQPSMINAEPTQQLTTVVNPDDLPRKNKKPTSNMTFFNQDPHVSQPINAPTTNVSHQSSITQQSAVDSQQNLFSFEPPPKKLRIYDAEGNSTIAGSTMNCNSPFSLNGVPLDSQYSYPSMGPLDEFLNDFKKLIDEIFYLNIDMINNSETWIDRIENVMIHITKSMNPINSEKLIIILTDALPNEGQSIILDNLRLIQQLNPNKLIISLLIGLYENRINPVEGYSIPNNRRSF